MAKIEEKLEIEALSMKLLHELKLQYDKGLWKLGRKLAAMDTILSQHPEIYGSR